MFDSCSNVMLLQTIKLLAKVEEDKTAGS